MSPHTVFDLSPSSLERTLTTLTAGGIVVCPSDTVYGILVDATNESAVKKLIDFKERPVGKAISVFVGSIDMMSEVVDTSGLTESARSLLPGPYTLVLPSRGTVSTLLESEKGTLGVRLIGHKSAIPNMQSANNFKNTNSNVQTLGSELEASQSKDVIPAKAGISRADFVTTLVSMFGKPVTATSANLAGKSSCYSVQALLRQLSPGKLAHLDLLIDIGELPHHPPSTVLDLTSPTPKVLRGTGAGQTIVTHSPEETMIVAEDFITGLLSAHRSQLSTINSQFIVYLHGDLGAGKTHFVKGIARHFGFDHITSPTYVGMQEYVNDRVKLYHVDLYNFESKEDVESLQLERLIGSQFAISNMQSANNVNANSQIPSSQSATADKSSKADQVPNKFQDSTVQTRNSQLTGLTDPVIPTPCKGGESRSSQLAAQILPSIICIEWPERGAPTYPGTHVYMEYGGDHARTIKIEESLQNHTLSWT
ncbi:MAG: tRNA (adenosine(37)-N6)-threonylcarbamoyltransferase complex ATPase subunit type 1 TsaE [bacterium]